MTKEPDCRHCVYVSFTEAYGNYDIFYRERRYYCGLAKKFFPSSCDTYRYNVDLDRGISTFSKFIYKAKNIFKKKRK